MSWCSKSALRKQDQGEASCILDFGFCARMDWPEPEEIVQAAGGTVVEKGEFVPGEPYLFVKDPDGNIVELWYELPTSADPKPRRARPPRS